MFLKADAARKITYSSLLLIIFLLVLMCCSCASSSSDDDNGEDGDQSTDGDTENGEESDGDSDGEEFPEDYIDYELWPSTHVLEETDAEKIISISEDGALTFAADSTIPGALAEKHVIIISPTEQLPRGLFRRVKDVTENPDGTFTVTTEPCALQHAFRKLHVKFTRPIELNADDIVWDLEPGTKISGPQASARLMDKNAKSGGRTLGPFTIDYYPFNGDNDPNTPEDQIHVVASFYGGAYYQFGIDFDWPDWDEVFTDPLPDIVAGFEVYAGAGAHLDVDGVAMKSYDRTEKLGSAYLGSFPIGPFWFFVNLDLLSQVKGAAASKFEMSAGFDTSFQMAAQYSTDGGGKFIPPTATFDTETPIVTASESASIRVSVGPRLKIELWDAFGPYAGVYLYGELAGDATKDPCWELNTGVSGDIGIMLELFGEELANWGTPYDIYDTTLFSGSCTIDPDAPDVPDVTDPTFTPWSKRIEDTVVSWDLDSDYVALDQTVDGSFLLSGSGANSLTKITKEGTLLWTQKYIRTEASTPTPLSITRAINTLDLGILATADDPIVIMKLNSDGELLWALRPYLPFQPSYGLQTAFEDEFGNVILGGANVPEDMAYGDAWILKIDPNGNVLWSKQWGTLDRSEWITGVTRVDDDWVFVGKSFGLSQDPAGQSFAMRIKQDGSTVWVTEISGCGDTDTVSLRTATISNDGDIIAGGSFGLGGPRTLLVKIKPDGSLGWANGNAGGIFGLDMTGMFELTDGGYLMSGTWWTGGDDHLWVARTDSVGRMSWLKQLNDGVDDGAPSIRLTGEGGALLAGYTSLGVDRHSLWLTRLPVKTGDIQLDPAAATVTSETFEVKENPCLNFTNSSLALTDLDVSFVSDNIEVTKINPNVQDLMP